MNAPEPNPRNHCSLVLVAGLIGCWWPTLAASATDPTSPTDVSLSHVESWKAQSAVARETKGAVEFELTVNYVNGRVESPAVPASGGELFRLAGNVSTEFPVSFT